MPFTKNAGPIALLPQHLTDCEFAGLDITRSARAFKRARSPPRSADLLPGVETVAGGGTDRRCAVRISEPYPFCRHAIQLRSLVGRLRVVAGQISVTEIVGIDNDDVGKRGGH